MSLRRLMLLLGAVCLLSCGEGGVAAQETETPLGPEIRLESVADGFAVPLGLTEPDDGSGRRFVFDQTGQVHVLEAGGRLLDEPFLDLADQIVDLDETYDERGLLGLTFHPDYADNGRFFVYYSTELRDGAPEGWDHTSHISEFQVSDDDPNQADPASERIVLQVDQPYGNHNGGQIAFGLDGYLYIPLGDGGNGGDIDAEGEDLGRPEAGWAQTIESILGSILRIDVDSGDPYGIPDDNPFVDEEEVPGELWAYGFRNPYGMSFDLETGDVYIADAGQARYEEITLVEPGGNHGWNIKEGTHCFNPDDFLNPPADCPDTGARGEPLIDPVIEYERGPEAGSVVVPGVRYRGASLPSLQGQFVFGDYGAIRYLPTGVLYTAAPDGDGLWPMERVSVAGTADEAGDLNRFLLGVYQDLAGELYLMTSGSGGPTGTSGEVFAVVSVEQTDGIPAIWWVLGAVAFVLLVFVAVFVARRRAQTAGGEQRAP